MDARLQRRVQRYGWDLAADDYETLWQTQLAPAQTRLLERVALQAGEQALDVACGTGLITLQAALSVGLQGQVTGVDLSARMVQMIGSSNSLEMCRWAGGSSQLAITRSISPSDSMRR